MEALNMLVETAGGWDILIGVGMGALIPGAQVRILPAIIKGIVWGLKTEFLGKSDAKQKND